LPLKKQSDTLQTHKNYYHIINSATLHSAAMRSAGQDSKVVAFTVLLVYNYSPFSLK